MRWKSKTGRGRWVIQVRWSDAYGRWKSSSSQYGFLKSTILGVCWLVASLYGKILTLFFLLCSYSSSYKTLSSWFVFTWSSHLHLAAPHVPLSKMVDLFLLNWALNVRMWRTGLLMNSVWEQGSFFFVNRIFIFVVV